MFAYCQQCNGKRLYIDTINGYDKHIHLLMLLKAGNSISKQMQLLKGESAHWAKQCGLLKDGLSCADKYFAASVSEDEIDKVRMYIKNQQTHHQKQTFAAEYNLFLKSVGYEIESD
ncbi:MAG: transposase [Chitinophagaceae bacterium]